MGIRPQQGTSNDYSTCFHAEIRKISVFYAEKVAKLGPFVQSIVSLSSSLRVISLTVLEDSIYNILIFFAEKI